MRRPRVETLLTCALVYGDERPNLLGVFHALPKVPRSFWVFIEFEYQEAFSYVVVVRNRLTGLRYETVENLVLKQHSGRMFDAFLFDEELAEALPGSYTMEVVEADSGRVLASRGLFFGEL